MKEFILNYYNYVLYTAILAWLSAQILKTIINSITVGSFNPERLIGAGGMPSAHSAFVTSATVAVARSSGVRSTEFAIIFIVAIVVMYDAMGVRRAAGQHAKAINMWNEYIDEIIAENADEENANEQGDNSKSQNKKLQEYLGHTPFEVLGGVLLGILVALVVPMR